MARQNLVKNPKRHSPRFGPGQLAIVAVCALAFFGPIKPGPDTDTWWHLATGELITAQGALPETDPYSWTARGNPWVVQAWGSDVIFSTIHTAAGAEGLLVLEGLLVGLTALLVLGTIRRYSSAPLVAAGALLASTFMGTLVWTIRPHLFTFLFFAAVMYLLTGNEDNPRRTWWLIPITIAWANLHAAFVVGLVLIALFAAVRSLVTREHRSWGVLGACIAASWLNPEGPLIYLHPLRVMAASRDVLEWQPPDLHDPASLVFALVVFGTFALLVLRKRSAPPELVVVGTVFAVAGFAAMRNIPLAGVAIAPCLAIALGGLLKQDGSRARATEGRALMGVASLLVVAGAAAAAANLWGSSEYELLGEKRFPAAAVAVLEELPPGRVANPYNWGGYLIYRAPGFPVSFDGRNDMYGPELLDRQMLLENLEPGWDEFLDDNDVDYVLWQRNRPLAEALRLDEGWRLVYEDRMAVLFEREGY